MTVSWFDWISSPGSCSRYLKLFLCVLSPAGRAEAGGVFPDQPAGADSSGVPGSGGFGDGTVPPREQGHAALPPTGAAGLDGPPQHRNRHLL